jgi:hypothetical protein
MYAQDQVTYSQNVNTENQCLYYINIITRDIIFTQKTIDSLIEQQWNTPIPQEIDQGQRTPLEEVFIIVVHLIFSF